MARRDEIKKAILDAAGNPSVGVIAEWADRFADAVVALDQPKPEPKREFDSRETRTVEAKERR
jgi:hypothetical protein